MAIITLLTDFGPTDHYVAALKAKILSVNPGVNIIDISHEIKLSDLAHASHVIKQCYTDFPEGTIHLISVGTTGHPKEKAMAIQLNNHYFVGVDNGLFGLISDQDAQFSVEIASTSESSSFIAKQLLGPVAAKLASGVSIQDIGNPFPNYHKMLPRHLRATKKQIAGNVLRIDHHGNAITNIEKKAFDVLNQDRQFDITFGRYHCRKIHGYYSQVDPGEFFVLFNDSGLLEIGIYQGNAAELLGLDYDSSVTISFEE